MMNHMFSYPPNQMSGYPQNYAANNNLPTLYVGDLEEYVTEDHLKQIFQKHGNIFNVRVMRKTGKGTSRGYAFVTFYSQQEAFTALAATNHLRLAERGKAMRVVWKKEKGIQDLPKEANIFIKNLDPNLKEADLDRVFSAYGTIVSSTIRTDDVGCSKGYGYVQLSDPEDARKCIEKLNQNPNEIQPLIEKGKQPIIKCFEAKQNRHDQIRDTTVFVFNLEPLPKGKEELQSLFSYYGGIADSSFKRYEDFDTVSKLATIKFKEKAGAEKCLSDNSLFSLPFRNHLYIKIYEKYDQTHLSTIFGQELSFIETKKYTGENDNDYCVLEFKDEQSAWNAHQKIRSMQLITLNKYRGLEMETFGNVIISCHPKDVPSKDNFNYLPNRPKIEETTFSGYELQQLTFENEEFAEKFMNRNCSQSYGAFVIKFFKDENTKEMTKAALDNARDFRCVFEPLRFVRNKNQVTKRFDETRNVFLKKIDKKKKAKDLKDEIESRGKFKVSSISIGVNDNGDSLGYGYVLFSNEEEAKNFVASNVLKGEGIEVRPFEQHGRKGKRSCALLYCRGFPHQQNESEMLEKHLKQILSEYGELNEKIFLKFSEYKKQFVAYIDFKLKESAVNALKGLEYQKENPVMKLYLKEKPEYEKTHNIAERLYIDWFEKPKKLFYMLNIKSTCLPHELESCLNQFLGISVKAPKVKCNQVGFNKLVKSAILKIDSKVEHQELKDIEKLLKSALNASGTRKERADALNNLRELLIDGKLIIKNYIERGERSSLSMDHSIDYDLKSYPDVFHPENSNLPFHPFMRYPMMNQGFMAPGFMMRPPMGPMNYHPFPRRNMPYNNRMPLNRQFQGPRDNSQYQRRPQQPYTHRNQRSNYPRNNPNEQKPNNITNVPTGNANPKQPPMNVVSSGPNPVIDPKPTSTPDFKNLKDVNQNLKKFLELPQDRQRVILGEMLFPLVQAQSSEDLAPKITGMLIDFTVFEITDILEFLNDEKALKERIAEALELINNPN